MNKSSKNTHKIPSGIIVPNLRLNQTNDFKSEDAQHTNMYVNTAESYENRLDHLKMGFGIRIAKAIASYGYCSRRDAEKLIEEGVVSVNGTVVSHPSLKVSEDDKIYIHGKLVTAKEAPGIWLYHKPKGLIVTHKDPEGRRTIFETLPKHLPRLVSVGRLDINSEGLIILTNSPTIAHHFESPKNEFERIYKVRVFGKLDESKLLSLKKGVTIEGIRYKPIESSVISSTDFNSWIEFRIKEGKNREIRNIIEYLGLKVSRLIRISYGPFDLGNIESGKIIKISDKVLGTIL